MKKRLSNNILRIEHVLDSIQKIESITDSTTLPEFLENWVVQDDVIRNIEIIGEPLNCIDKDLKSKYPKVPWVLAKDMRNLLAHEYFRVDISEVWATAKRNLPELKVSIGLILKELDTE